MRISYYASRPPAPDLGTCQGENKQGILILVQDRDLPGQLPFLNKVLKAISVDLARDVHLLGIRSETYFVVTRLPGTEAYKTCLTFGLTPDHLGLPGQAEIDRTVRYPFEKLAILCCPALSEIAVNPALKKDLWDSLKATFVSQ